MLADSISQHRKIVEKIPFVRGLSGSQIQKVLHAGQIVHFEVSRKLCQDGDKSTEMFILLTGELAVKDGKLELARVKPVEIVGEMGLITGQPRCATIEVVQEATLISIRKMHFDVLLKNDVDMASRIYKNMLDSLSNKLRVNNERIKKDQSVSDREITASVV